jgi:hypothetical protein
MQTETIEFQASIQNGIVHIPDKYCFNQNNNAKFLVKMERINIGIDNKTPQKFNPTTCIDTKNYKFSREEANAR